jgi:hypothetical protein
MKQSDGFVTKLRVHGGVISLCCSGRRDCVVVLRNGKVNPLGEAQASRRLFFSGIAAAFVVVSDPAGGN